MGNSKITRRGLMSLLPIGVLGLANCVPSGSSYDVKLDSDAQFKEMVLRAMPEFRLTQAITGRPVVRSPGYALKRVDIRLEPRTIVRNFLAQFENEGLLPVNLYLHLVTDEEYWKIEFPGCKPQGCADLATNLKFQHVSEIEHDRYYPPRAGGSFARYPIISKNLGGVNYAAIAVVSYDYKGRVVSYNVQFNRVAINEIERKWVGRNARSDRSHPIDVYQYSHNLALGVSEFNDNGPSIGGTRWD